MRGMPARVDVRQHVPAPGRDGVRGADGGERRRLPRLLDHLRDQRGRTIRRQASARESDLMSRLSQQRPEERGLVPRVGRVRDERAAGAAQHARVDFFAHVVAHERDQARRVRSESAA